MLDGPIWSPNTDPPESQLEARTAVHKEGAPVVPIVKINEPTAIYAAPGAILKSTLDHNYPRPLVLDCTDQGFTVKDKAMLFYGEPITDYNERIERALQRIKDRDAEYQRAEANPPRIKREAPKVVSVPIKEPSLYARLKRRAYVRRKYVRWSKR